MKYSQFRAALLTFAMGLASVTFFNFAHGKYTEIPVELPEAEFGTVLPVYVEMPGKPFNMQGGGGGSGGRDCDDFIKSLGKLNKKTQRILAESPCSDEIVK